MFGNPDVYPLVCLVTCLQKLMYSDSSDHEDENLELSKTVLDFSYKNFCRIVKDKFGALYLNRCPTDEDLQWLQVINHGHCFPGLFSSWDCKHFPWKLCPVAWQGQFHNGKEPGPSLLMEAIADADLFI